MRQAKNTHRRCVNIVGALQMHIQMQLRARRRHDHPTNTRHVNKEESIVKFPVQRLFAFRTLAVCAALAASAVSVATYAQTTQPTEHATRASVRKANHRLEHDVRVALNHAKIDTADVRIVARSGKVTLDGTVPEDGMVQTAGTTAGAVAGVTSVSNQLTMREKGH
jgi:hyperosmotically inducible periplasmic protein